MHSFALRVSVISHRFCCLFSHKPRPKNCSHQHLSALKCDSWYIWFLRKWSSLLLCNFSSLWCKLQRENLKLYLQSQKLLKWRRGKLVGTNLCLLQFVVVSWRVEIDLQVKWVSGLEKQVLWSGLKTIEVSTETVSRTKLMTIDSLSTTSLWTFSRMKKYFWLLC